jgi:hypothetical protein
MEPWSMPRGAVEACRHCTHATAACGHGAVEARRGPSLARGAEAPEERRRMRYGRGRAKRLVDTRGTRLRL